VGGDMLNQADLRGADLSPLPLGAGRSLPADLRKASLRYARLEGAVLTGAQTDGADFSGADRPDLEAVA
jgi:uncharacterized protein YjbI with pentapeptide repeats